jgi:hypothetical protein
MPLMVKEQQLKREMMFIEWRKQTRLLLIFQDKNIERVARERERVFI